jgi:hypothetical protein
MNTLGRSITCQFFKSADDYGRLKQAWFQAMQARTKLSAAHHTLYLILRAKNWTKAFTQAKVFSHPAELAIVRVRYRIALPRAMRRNRSEVYEYFAQYLADDAEDHIEPLLLKVAEMESAIKEGKPIDPYRMPIEVKSNA